MFKNEKRDYCAAAQGEHDKNRAKEYQSEISLLIIHFLMFSISSFHLLFQKFELHIVMKFLLKYFVNINDCIEHRMKVFFLDGDVSKRHNYDYDAEN